ncbi:MAG: NAD-dependent epimerase/dehydratase family protein [Desulfatiglans sp.]|jgi:nucleoside-diphosphate-sugar epimerase|nr:NAD-dependent epimerase/dehydratase family protein [Thermodesulfobacteriota bacterium]MEE4354750.1 NAD-dependent epimerase/dehydratase family protein [Desulfatiglans sp.]
MKDVLIIGGSYFVGRVFVEELIKAGNYQIHLFNRGNIPFQREEVLEYTGDRNDEERIKEVIPKKEWYAVVDFCGYTPDHITKMITSIPGNIKKYVFISTTTIYKEVLDLPIRENAPKVDSPQPELGDYAHYGYHKWLAECSLREACRGRGISYTCLRPAIIYGKYNYAPREYYFFNLISDHRPIILPDNELALFSFVWVEDVARMILRCMESDKANNLALNTCAEELVSYQRFIEVLEEILGKRIETIKMSSAEIDRRRIPLPFPLDNHLAYSGAKAGRILDFEYTPFVEGMKKTYEHYQWLQAKKTK